MKKSAPTGNDSFKVTGGSYSVSDIQDYYEHIIKENETLTYSTPLRIHIIRIQKRIGFKIKTEYYREF